jgi:hypothetical protein
MKRRDFLKATAVGGAAAATIGTKVRRASAVSLFGDVPADHSSVMLPKANQATNILECFMYGGVVPWEGFYCVPDYGSTTARTWHKAYPTDFANASIACGYDAANPFTPFANDSSGRQIFLSPFLAPLLARTDITDRMRVVVNRHTLEPHEAAIPLVMSGKTLGSPSLASLGAHVARYFVDHDVDNLHPSPFAYGMSGGSNFVPTDNILTMLATGLHPGAARPLHIKTDSALRLSALLNRNVIGSLDDRARYDALLQIYASQYDNRLKFGGTSGARLRAPRFGELTSAVSSLAHAADIQSMISSNYLTALPGESCYRRKSGTTGPDKSVIDTVKVTNTINNVQMGLKLAAHLLTDTQFPAKHCMVVDTGLTEADGGGGYDTHSETPFTQARNLYNFFGGLLPLINGPGESDPNKIDLNKTMIILNMEFGRTPGLQGSATGRNHWPYGYAQVYIGGPITTAQRGVYGVIAESGQATTYTTPTENRIAALLALGIWPFDSASYSGSNVQNETLEGPAVQSVLKRVLGYTV